jgi:hypothetical protein
MPRRTTTIVIRFKTPPLSLFAAHEADPISPNYLIFKIQPEEGIALQVRAKIPGPTISTRSVKLDFGYDQFRDRQPTTGYEKLLYDCMVGDAGNQEPMFMLVRKETRLPDDGTQVEESRRYFGSKDQTNAVLILELRKERAFQGGRIDRHDTRSKCGCRSGEGARIQSRRRAVQHSRSIKGNRPASGDRSRVTGSRFPDADPFARVKGDSEKFRIIQARRSSLG